MSTLDSPTWSVGLKANVTGGSAIQPATANISAGKTGSWNVGTSAGQVNEAYGSVVSVLSGTPTNIDLLTLTDALGAAISFATLEAVMVINLSKTTGEDITVGGGTNAVFASLPEVLKATSSGDSTLFFKTPITVDSTHHILELTAASGSAVQVAVVLFGR